VDWPAAGTRSILVLTTAAAHSRPRRPKEVGGVNFNQESSALFLVVYDVAHGIHRFSDTAANMTLCLLGFSFVLQATIA
jgi:hypothetical protein